MSNDLLKAVRALEQLSVATTRHEYFQKLRDPNKSEVFDNFFAIVSADDPTISKTTGRKHTVESMVSELHDRVCLDAVLQKRSADEPLILSRRARYMADDGKVLDEEALKTELEEFSRKYFLERDHGLSSVETMIEDFKSQPGGMRAIESYGRERVRDMLKVIVEKYPKDDPMASIPSSGAVTMPAADQTTTEQANIGMSGSSGVAPR